MQFEIKQGTDATRISYILIPVDDDADMEGWNAYARTLFVALAQGLLSTGKEATYSEMIQVLESSNEELLSLCKTNSFYGVGAKRIFALFTSQWHGALEGILKVLLSSLRVRYLEAEQQRQSTAREVDYGKWHPDCEGDRGGDQPAS